MKRKLLVIRCILFVIVVSSINLSFRPKINAMGHDDMKRVLIMNSYHERMTWTKDQVEGITETLLNSGYNINFSTEYMDWKNYATDENLQYLYDYCKYKYQKKEIDLILTTDDAALDFVLKNRKELFSNAAVVFCGVNEEGAKKITKGYDRVAGVIEQIDPTDTIGLALRLNPDVDRLYLLYDNTESGLTTGQLIINKTSEKFPNLEVISCNDMDFKDILSEVEQLEDNSIVMITTYFSDKSNITMEMEYVSRSVSKSSNVPVYHLYDFGLNQGAMGGVMLSGELQGKYAANLALRVLAGENMESVGFITPNCTRAALDYTQLDRFNLSKKNIPSNIEIVNKPFSFYETYKSLVLGVVAIIIMLVIFINILLFYIRSIKKMKKNLADSHEELTQLYEELTASDEEMRQQYDEILEINEKIRMGEEKVSYLAYHDILTGLPNKLSLFEDGHNLFGPESGKAALLFIDIDNFKNVNDTMGHAFGDELIKNVSERLSNLLEDKNSIYRLSGDEFIIVLKNLKSSEEVQHIATNILSKFSKEFEILGSVLHVSVSIGIVLYPEHGNNLEELLKYADIAMYRVKENGRKNYAFYNELMNEVFIERVNIEKHLHNALENNEFVLHYQPQLDIKSNRITGFEALLRWNSPQLGNISPLKFIKIAEDTRVIIPLGEWVLRTACVFLKKLNTMGYKDLKMSVNISILQLLQTDFCQMVTNTLKEVELEPKYLELEITETILMESIESIGMELIRLSELDIQIALDDFGKGYSSLNYLRQLPISTLKVDKSFIDSILNDKENTLTGQIVTLGKSMGMCVIAEGVEQEEQLEYLYHYNCDKIQGYLYSRPIPEEEVIRLLTETCKKD